MKAKGITGVQRKDKTSQMEKLYLRIPTSVDAIIVTMQNGKYNAVLLTKMVLNDLTIYALPLWETEVTLYMSRIDSSINKHSTNTTILS